MSKNALFYFMVLPVFVLFWAIWKQLGEFKVSLSLSLSDTHCVSRTPQAGPTRART